MKRLVAVALLAAMAAAVPAAEAQGRHDERHECREWRFDRGFGWRCEHRPGVWSPYYVWWWTNGQVVLLPTPSARVVHYATGRYELQGNGITVPYHWVWVPGPRYTVVAPPPPPGVPPAPPAMVTPPAGAPPPPPSPSASAPPSPGTPGSRQEWRCDVNGFCQWMPVP